MTLAAALFLLPPPQSDWEGRILRGLPAGVATLADLAAGGEALCAMVAAKRDQAKGGDDRLGCAYLIGDISWQIGHLLGGLWMRGWHVGLVNPSAIAVTLRGVAWDDAGTAAVYPVVDLHLDSGALHDGPPDPVHLAGAMVDLHLGLVQALAPMTGLGPAAQWRLVGDGISGALLEQGKTLGQVPRAIALAREILSLRGTKLWAKQGDFVEIVLPGATIGGPARARDWFRLRGGCCRFYTSAGGEYCSTCVLRDRDDQISRLQAYLGGTLAAE